MCRSAHRYPTLVQGPVVPTAPIAPPEPVYLSISSQPVEEIHLPLPVAIEIAVNQNAQRGPWNCGAVPPSRLVIALFMAVLFAVALLLIKLTVN